VREYNLKWNFFTNATEEEMDDAYKSSQTGDRPTKPFGKKSVEQQAWARLGVDDAHEVLGDNATKNPGKSDPIKKQYKSLIKVLHPDVNGGDRSQEEQLQEVVWAWDHLKDSRYFK